MEIRKTEPVMNVIDAEFKEIIQILCIDKNQGNDENIYRVEVYQKGSTKRTASVDFSQKDMLEERDHKDTKDCKGI